MWDPGVGDDEGVIVCRRMVLTEEVELGKTASGLLWGQLHIAQTKPPPTQTPVPRLSHRHSDGERRASAPRAAEKKPFPPPGRGLQGTAWMQVAVETPQRRIGLITVHWTVRLLYSVCTMYRCTDAPYAFRQTGSEGGWSAWCKWSCVRREW